MQQSYVSYAKYPTEATPLDPEMQPLMLYNPPLLVEIRRQ